MAKKITLLFILFAICLSFTFAQTTNDPNDEIYDYMTIWEGKGYIKNLPPLRPYPTQLIIKFLEDVSLKADGRDKEAADKYLEKFAEFSLSAGIKHTSRFTAADYYGETGANVKLEGMLSPDISISGDINLLLVDMPGANALPSYMRPTRDLLPDWSDVTIFNKNYLVRQGLNTSTAVGTENMYFQTGLIRSSFGPFFDDGAVISPTAPQSGHFSFTWRHEAFTFTSALLSLTATTDTGAGRYPEKFLALHSVNFYPFDWLEISAFESIVYGGRFEPLYLIPFSEFFYLQGVLGFPDNSLLGFSTSVDLPHNIDFDFLLYADDLHFNDMIKFDFDTKYKLSLQAGLSWTPEIKELSRIAFDYMLVTPYMYTHIDNNAGTVNYQNYTNLGISMGPALEPNSDRMSLSVLLQPLDFLKIEVLGRYIRHANGSVAGSTNVGGGDGTIFDDGWNDGVCTFQETTRFMVQDIIEYTFQAGLKADLVFDVDVFKITGFGGYTSEWVINKNLIAGSSEWNNYFEIGLGVSY